MSKMSFGITFNNNLYNQKLAGVDAQSINQITQEILKRANTNQPKTQNLDFSRLKKADLGVDFYSKTTNAELSRQISIQNAGLDVSLNQNLINSINFFNSQAAQSAYIAQQKSKDGNIFIHNIEQTIDPTRENGKINAGDNLVQNNGLGKDKRGGNPFFVLTNKKDEESNEKTQTADLNIFI